MNVVEAHGDYFYVVKDKKVKVNYQKALRSYMRIRFGSKNETGDLCDFLALHAFALPDYVLRDLPVMVTEITTPSDSSEQGFDYTVEYVYRNGQRITYTDEESGPQHRLPIDVEGVEGSDWAYIPLERLRHFREELDYVSSLAFVNAGYDIHPPNVEQDGLDDADWKASTTCSLHDELWSWSYSDFNNDESYSHYMRFVYMPDALAFGIQQKKRDNDSIVIRRFEGISKVEIIDFFLTPELQGVGGIIVTVTPNDACWKYKNDSVAMHRICAGCLFQIVTSSTDTIVSIEDESLFPLENKKVTMLSELYEQAKHGEITPCGWCGKPVFHEKYCHGTRCRKNDHEQARAMFSIGSSADEIHQKHPAISMKTIQNWFDRDGE